MGRAFRRLLLRMRKQYRLVAFVLTLLFLFSITSCKAGDEEETYVADYGKAGSKIALEIASNFPYRNPGSAGERACADYIADKLAAFGYDVLRQPFMYTRADGSQGESENILASREGRGFVHAESRKDAEELSKNWVIIGCHYDAAVAAEQASGAVSGLFVQHIPKDDGTVLESVSGLPTLADYDGIHDNASGVATVLLAAKLMQDSPPGYDVTFAFFGAGNDSYAGARAYAASLDNEALRQLVGMYNVCGIYAGDKVYAHAGQNSVRAGNEKSYDMRRKLYEATDVFYAHTLYTNNGYSSIRIRHRSCLIGRPPVAKSFIASGQ